MTTPAFIQTFRALRTSSARGDALAALADELSRHEWRTLQAMASAKSFQCDIIGALPAELVFHIFSYLDIATPFRLQTVSFSLHSPAVAYSVSSMERYVHTTGHMRPPCMQQRTV